MTLKRFGGTKLSRINAVKVALDTALTLGFLVLMEPRATGLSLHEWGGLGICVFFFIHIILNSRWVTAISLGFFHRGTSWANRLRYVLDLVLLIGLGLIIASGMAIAKTIDFRWLIAEAPFWRGAHGAGAFLTLLAFGVHMGLHAGWIFCRARELLPSGATEGCREHGLARATEGADRGR